MKRAALFFDRSYVDAHFCYTELAKHLADDGYMVDLYHLTNPYNSPPVFFDDRIRVFNFPLSKFQKIEFWTKIQFYKDFKYSVAFGTPVKGIWLAYKVAKKQNIPLIYLADEIINPETKHFKGIDYEKDKRKDIKANNYAIATIALSERRYLYQKKVNSLSDTHKYFVIPNAPAGKSEKLKSNYFRDVFNIKDLKPIVLFIGSINWKLAKQIFEDTKEFKNKDYHIIFHGRSKNQMGDEDHPFIKISDTPLPSYLINYAFSSADIALVLYDKSSLAEAENGETGGKIGTYLKNNLPVIAGNLELFKDFESNNVGVFWDGLENIDKIITKTLSEKDKLCKNISSYYEKNYNYSNYFKKLRDFLDEDI
ncbi:MAG: hypothetical protein JXL97_20155 [Bacteroidales bacterium]|nr:hypothetical protein [Bacteroidales bacterium]